MESMVEKVYQKLVENQDLEYQKFQSNLCPGISNILGVRVPIIRKIVKELLREDYRFYLDHVTNQYYEETMIEGLLIAQSKMPLEEKFLYLDSFVPKIDNWAVCDICTSSFHLKENELPLVWNYLQKYMSSTKEFEVRFAVIMFMDYFLEEPYIDQVLQVIDSIRLEDYYVKMAIAWLLSVLYVKDKKKTISYLKKNHLSSWTYQKALQKMIESTRISKEEKDQIRRMKKEAMS